MGDIGEVGWGYQGRVTDLGQSRCLEEGEVFYRGGISSVILEIRKYYKQFRLGHV